jgi:RNA methyltransferase, TrmH family
VFEASASVIAAACDTVAPQGIVAVVPLQDPGGMPERVSLALVLDSLQDPGNLGTILRTAQAAGADGVWLTPGSVDPYNAKVVRSGMGAHFRLPIHMDTELPDLRVLVTRVDQVLAAATCGKALYFDANWVVPSLLVIGNEAWGVGPEVATILTGSVRIPMPGGAESLNAAVATAVILFEAIRQRSVAGRAG